MTTKTFLTSAVAMGFIAPVMAAPTNTGTFPSGGLMQADYTYTNAATSTNMDGVYEGTVNAVAQYTDVLYQIAAGEYLPADSETVTSCNQPGYFCPGVSGGVYYDENNAQGLTSCSTATNGAYTLSAGTGSSINTCYRECTNADVAHSTGTMNGGYYYGDNNQCEPTDCVNGWHIKPGFNASTAVGTGEGASRAYINNENSFTEDMASYGQSFYGISGANTWAVNYGNNGILVGQARCSTQSGQGAWDWSNNTAQTPTTFASLTDETGQEGARYCYCNVTGYKSSSSSALQSLSSSWVFFHDYASSCASNCAYYCSSNMQDPRSNALAFRAALLGSVGASPASCEANTITINWDGASQAAINANNAGTATYGSDIRTPQSAEHVPGKTFTGWRFSRPIQTNLPE